ncbi:hypothetical protein BHM03_00004556 [Ensete ventricosum]|nr:hypothetical protein BHM03_00004556 [Ensete ventricosum]
MNLQQKLQPEKVPGLMLYQNLHYHHESSLSFPSFDSRNSEVTSTNPVNGAEADQNKDEEVSLLHWLKKVSKKFVTDDFQNKKALGAKRSAAIKHMEKVGLSPSAHNEKDANSLPKGSGVSKQNKCYTVVKENKNADHSTEAYNCAKYQKHILIDLNQQATEFLTIPAYDGHQSNMTHVPVVDSKKTDSLPSSCGRIRMQDLGSYQKDGVSAQSSIAGTHDMLSDPANSRKYGISAGNIDVHCNYDSFLDRNQKTVVKMTDYQEPMILAGSHILNAGGKSELSANRTTQPTTSCIVGGGNRCHSGGTGPMDLSSNDMISAMHLLRLVDQAALTGTSWDINRIGIAQNSNLNFTNQSTQVLGVKNGIKIREAYENLPATGHSAHNQNEGNFSRPHRPVPRVGVLGSLLQKEIMTRSNKCVAPLGCGARLTGELPSFFIEGKGRTDASSSANHTEYGDHSSQLSVTASTKPIVKAGDYPVHKFETRQVGVSKNNELIQSVRHDTTTTNCIVNRNPADFSIPDEDNIYMRGFEDVSSKCPFPHKNPLYQTHHDGKKWQAMKLPVLKGP